MKREGKKLITVGQCYKRVGLDLWGHDLKVVSQQQQQQLSPFYDLSGSPQVRTYELERIPAPWLVGQGESELPILLLCRPQPGLEWGEHFRLAQGELLAPGRKWFFIIVKKRMIENLVCVFQYRSSAQLNCPYIGRFTCFAHCICSIQKGTIAIKTFVRLVNGLFVFNNGLMSGDMCNKIMPGPVILFHVFPHCCDFRARS